MFKKTSIANEVADEMEKLNMLVFEKEHFLNSEKYIRALECLNKAAVLFDNAGLIKQAESITLIIEAITKSADQINEGNLGDVTDITATTDEDEDEENPDVFWEDEE